MRARCVYVRVMPLGDAPTELRVYGAMQTLMRYYANKQAPPSTQSRDVVELQDALEAVLQVAAVIDEFTQAGAIPQERGVHAGAMLMVVRDFLRPLPPGIGGDGRDRLTEDLQELVDVLRDVRQTSGYAG